MNEFELIHHFFARAKKQRNDVLLGIGDDGALLQVPKGQSLAVTTDTLVAGIHFPDDTSPYDIGYKSLAVNLSDLAAMGAEPSWVTLSLTLPTADENWLKEFSRGFFSLINRYGLQLVGGDTTHGPLSITVQVHGFVPFNKVLRRDQAKPGDLIYVTGTLGDAGAGLQLIRLSPGACEGARQIKKSASFFLSSAHTGMCGLGFLAKQDALAEKRVGGEGASDLHGLSKKHLLQRLNRPIPRIEVGLALRGISHCAIDISDGLAADLSHILQASHVGAKVIVEDLPISLALNKNLSKPEVWSLALNAGDDYELCFTIPPRQEAKLKKALASIKCSYTQIGTIEKKRGLRLQYRDGRDCDIATKGYQHFN